MNHTSDVRCAADDATGLLGEIARRDKMIDALVYQVEHNLNDQDRDFALLQTTFMLEEQIRQRTGELNTTLDILSEATARATSAREQLEAAVESISDGFALFDPEDRILLCNEAFRRLWGLRGRITGQHFTELLARATRPGASNAVLARLNACRAGQTRCELALPSGLSLQIRERRMEDGCLVGIYADVTDLKAEEARVRQQEIARRSLLLQATLDTIDQGIAVFDKDNRLLAWNQRFFQLLALPLRLAKAATTLEEMTELSQPVARLGLPPATGSSLRFELHTESGESLELARYPMPDDGCVLTASDITSLKTREARIHLLLQRQRAIFDNANVGIAFVHERCMIDVNNHMAEIFGYTSPDELIGQSTEVLYPSHTDFVSVGERIYADLAAGGYAERSERMRRKNGRLLWIQLSGRPVDIRTPNAGSIWVFSDVTGEREQQAQLELAQLVFNHINEALMVIDADHCVESINTAFTSITGFSAAETVGLAPPILHSGEHEPAFYEAIHAALDAHDHWEGELFDRRKNGQTYPAWLTIRVVRNLDRSVAHYVAAFSDISARKSAEERIQYMAHHDTLTGLPNRLLLRDRFDQMHHRVNRQHGALAMYFLDLDHFKHINDTLGHAVGDELLIRVTDRLSRCLRRCDTISRLGGDEFIILVEGDESSQPFAAIAEKICNSLEVPFEIGGNSLTSTGTLGIAVSPADGNDFDTLMKKADMAMYHAKGVGRGTFSFFDERMNRDSADRLNRTTALRHALANGELRLVYQPQFALCNNRITGAEALMRWQSAQFGTVSPGEFIPLAEETGLILPIGEWALHTACRKASELAAGTQPMKIGVNVSAVQLYRGDFPRTLSAILRDTGAAPELIELELTESTLMADTARFADLIAHVRSLGISVAIDDFGTGYSSLAYLRRFQVSKLKVDRSFVKDIPDDDESRAIAEAIVRMGQSLKLTVIAEGVETHAQRDYLAEIGCHEIQGYLMSHPLEACAFAALIGGRP